MLDETMRQIIRDEVRVAVKEAMREALPPPTPPSAPSQEWNYLSTKEAATIADVNTGTIRVWVDQGKLRRFNAGRKLRIERNDLNRFMSTPQSVRPEKVETDDVVMRVLAKSSTRAAK